jgi:hypothetical protein
MIPITTKEMEPPIKQRFHFAASSFSRTYGVNKVTEEMLDFSLRWAETTMPAPLDCLHSVDRYFRQLWETKSFGESLHS